MPPYSQSAKVVGATSNNGFLINIASRCMCVCGPGVSELWWWHWGRWDGSWCTEAWWLGAVACGVFHMCMLSGTACQPVLLPQRRQHLLRTALCRTRATTMRCMWWGMYWLTVQLTLT